MATKANTPKVVHKVTGQCLKFCPKHPTQRLRVFGCATCHWEGIKDVAELVMRKSTQAPAKDQ